MMSSNSSSDRCEIRCPHCDAGHTCPAGNLGKRVICTKCGREFRIPEVVCAPETPESPARVGGSSFALNARTAPTTSPFRVNVAPRNSRREERRTRPIKIILAVSAVALTAIVIVLLVGALMIAVGSKDPGRAADNAITGSDIASMILGAVLFLLVFAVAVVAYFLPTAIAIYRKHRFLGIIFVLNLAGGWSVLGWFAALAWAVWPSETVFTDVFTHDPTGLSLRNVGHAAGEIRNAYDDVRHSRFQT